MTSNSLFDGFVTIKADGIFAGARKQCGTLRETLKAISSLHDLQFTIVMRCAGTGTILCREPAFNHLMKRFEAREGSIDRKKFKAPV